MSEQNRGGEKNPDEPATHASEKPISGKWHIDDIRVAHVLFMDIVGYSKFATDEQTRLIHKLHKAVRNSPSFQQLQHGDDLIRLPAGDGMALVFFRDPVLAAKCAMEIAAECKPDPQLLLRMGINSGPVYRVSDINSQTNVAGAGINDAQRVMSCAQDGQILLSKSTADVLLNLSTWQDLLHPIGEYSVKHGKVLQLYNLFSDTIGNPKAPARHADPAKTPRAVPKPEISFISWRYPVQLNFRRRRSAVKVIVAAGIVAAALLAWKIFVPRQTGTVPLSIRSLNLTANSDFHPQVSKDGHFLAYALSDRNEKSDVYIQRIYPEGGLDAPEKLTGQDCFDYQQPVFSPDGRLIAARANLHIGKNADRDTCASAGSTEREGIVLIDVATRNARAVTNHGYDPSWSPDGTLLVYATEGIQRPDDRHTPKSALESVNVRTGEIRTIYDGDAVSPMWSPHGLRIAFWAVDRQGHRDIATISASGEEPRSITNDAAVDWDPVWSPDGRYIYFASDRDGPSTLWRVAIDERTGIEKSTPEKLGSLPGDSSHVSFLNNASSILFVDRAVTSDIVKADFDPKTSSASTPDVVTRGLVATRPDLSPDGTRLVFNAMMGKRDDIYTVSVEGKDYVRLLSDGSVNRGPRWSPSGKQIAYFANKSGTWQLWIQTASQQPVQVTSDPGLGALYPVWGPDGGTLAFTRRGSKSAEWQCFTMDTGKRQPAALPPLGDAFHSFTAWSWSPDRKYIAGYLQSTDGKFSGISVLSLEAKTYRQITTFGRDPVWLKDSATLLFSDQGRIWSINSAAKAPEATLHQVISVAPNEVTSRGFALSRDNRTIFFGLQRVRSDVMLGQIDAR
ncbi:MAG TPA: adenylate/guanylate cyclase domain-containing protein [Bryobacteraceae bacterium]